MRKINVLFMQSQEFFGADSMIHSLLMRYLDRNAFTVHIASNHESEGGRPAAYKILSSIPDVEHRHTRFGPSVSKQGRAEVVREFITTVSAATLSLAGLIAYCRRHQIDVIHCTEKPRDAFLGLLVAKAAGARCVIHIHVKAENWLRSQVRWAMKHADALIGVSEFVSSSIVALGYPREKAFTVLNSLDLSRWNNQDDGISDTEGWSINKDGRALRGEFRLVTDMPLMAIVSRPTPWKGHKELIRALALVKDTVPDFRLLLVGESEFGGEDYGSQFRQLASELGLARHIVFTGYRRDVPDIMAACDIYTMPSFEEPFGVVYLEAMAMCKPIVALDNGGTREVVEHGKSGLLSLPQDIEHLAANIVSLLKDADLRARMGRYGRRRVEAYFTPQRLARDMEQIYKRLLQIPRNAA